MGRRIDYFKKRLGRRGLVLILIAVTFVLLGVKALISPLPFNDEQFVVPYTLMPFWLRALLWSVPAVLAIFAATVRHGRNDALGFSALAIPATVVFCSYLIAYITSLIGVTPPNFYWVDALRWFVILAILMVTSGWAEVDRSVEVVRLVDKGN